MVWQILFGSPVDKDMEELKAEKKELIKISNPN